MKVSMDGHHIVQTSLQSVLLKHKVAAVHTHDRCEADRARMAACFRSDKSAIWPFVRAARIEDPYHQLYESSPAVCRRAGRS